MPNTSPEEWGSWVEDQLQKMEDVYHRDEDRLFSDYNRETKHIDGYSGRGLLELIQNADDAGWESSGSVDVLIELTEEGLFVANSGEPFSREGISSLMLSDNSPKQFREECIGYKGLGFRSILNWSSDVLIQSGEVSIGFSEQFASEFLNKLRAENDEIDRKAKRYEQRGTSNPIATLSTPRLLSESDVVDTRFEEVYKQGQQIKAQGYDTVICIPLSDSGSRNQVQKEINSLFKELTLFLRSVDDLRIRSPEREEDWSVERGGEKVIVDHGSGEPTTWKIFKDSGEIPEEYTTASQTKDRYEIKIAIPENTGWTELPSDLFVFFPTKVSFPFPMLAHATFQVTESRNHLIESDANRFVAEQLASKMIDAAEDHRSEETPWAALRTVSPTGPIGSTLNNLGAPDEDQTSFKQLLESEVATRSLIPVQDGSFTTPAEAKRISGDFDDLLQGELFDDVCLHTNSHDVRSQLDRLDVGYIDYTDLRTRLDSISSDLSMTARAGIITRLVDNNLIGDETPPRLLIDGEGSTIPSERTTFLPPQGESITLPSWVPRDILHPDLASKLQSSWGLTSIRDLRMKLSSFNIREYELSGLVQAVVTEANDRVSQDPDAEGRWRRKMLRGLWDLYEAGAKGVTLTEVSIVIPTRTGTFAKASSLYLTGEYPNGKLVEHLYESVDQELFVVNPTELDFCDDVSKLESFLLWLGVADEPRLERREMSNSDFFDHVLETLDYPAEFGSETKETPNDVTSTRNYRLRRVETVDQLEEIVESAHPYAILAWLATIPETTNRWRKNGSDAILEIKPKYHQNWKSLNEQSVPSHPYWILRTSQWLPVQGEETNLQTPQTCSTASLAEDISPLVGYPAVDPEYPLFSELGVDETDISKTLRDLGVTNTLADLSWESFYEILFNLPDRDPDGKVAKRVYRTLLKNRESDETPPASLRADFIENGEMFGTHEGVEGYYPVSELRYTNTDSIPTPVEDRYPSLMLDNRQGTEKVKQFFGVDGLTNSDIDISDVDHDHHLYREEFSQEVEDLKPFIYAFRVDGDDNRRELRAIRDVEIVLCNAVKATASVGSDTFDIELQQGSYLIDESTVYVVPDILDGRPQVTDDHLARLVGDIFSDVLDKKLSKDILSLATADDRGQRLEVLLGDESAKERLRESKAHLTGETSVESDSVFTAPEVTDGMDRTKKPERDQSGGSPSRDGSAVNSQQTTNETSASTAQSGIDESIEGVSSKQQDFETVEGRSITIRRTAPTSQSRSTSGTYDVPDSEGAEKLAYWFEIDAGRFPILVSHIQGSESYGCDVLSFETEERKEAFESDPDRALIDRYIEVKSSTSQQGYVTLDDGQVQQALSHQERFYLYRVYDGSSEDGSYELAVLENPLAHGDAVKQKASIDPYRTEEAVRYSLDLISNEQDD
ncbi:hypothetical protein Hjap01_04331 [Haloarcula japonica]